MLENALTVQAPSRLHFGLLSFNNPQSKQFGGVGIMISRPGITLNVRPSTSFRCCGVHANRVAAFAEVWQRYHHLDSLPHCEIEVETAPPQHVGLGLGTQLALSTASALNQYAQGKVANAVELAKSVGRGRRSAIGTHGFEQGGFLFELGKSDADEVSVLERRIAMPASWRVLLIRPELPEGLSGNVEQAAFAELPPVPLAVTETLTSEIITNMIPALESSDLDRFAQSVACYGETAGRCFQACQGGPYASPQVHEVVDRLRRIDIPVSQSSWGPTLFAFAESQAAAESLVTRVQQNDIAVQIEISEPNNHGATISVADGPHAAS
ncbi:MAG: hypothetical protein KDB27_26170 [Planctomycetales bacterium]|nr:hypothetical protein [Planctomycetales bacterium]